MRKQLAGSLAILMCLVGLLFLMKKNKKIETPYKTTILITQVVEHPALNATVKGIIDELNAHKEQCNIRVESAQTNSALAAQIAAKFVYQNPAVIVGVGTLSAQSLLKYQQNKAIDFVFSSVTDPIGAQLVAPESSTAFMHGVSNFVDLEPQVKLFKRIQPDLKRLGILYNPNEASIATFVIKNLAIICEKMNIELIQQTMTSTAAAVTAATYLSQKVDALFICNDNTALAALPSIIAVTNKAKIPTYVSDTDAVKEGALAAVGPNQYAVGRQTGTLIIKLLNKEQVPPIEYPTSTELFINLKTAQTLGLTIPEDIISQAHTVIQ